MFERLHKILKDENRIEAFDFVRAIAALSVILTHFELMDLYSIDIDAFFLLSGFLISQILCLDKPQVNQRYFVSRLTKIVPSYFFFLIIGLAIGGLLFKEVYGENLPPLAEWKQYFLFYRNYAGLPNRWALEHVWTICVEEHFYLLILGFSVLFSDRIIFKSRLLYFALALVVLGLISKTQAIFTSFAEYPTYTHNRIDVFGYGILLFLLMDQIRVSSWARQFLLLILSIGILTLLVYHDSTPHLLVLRIFSPILLSAIFIAIIDWPFHKVFRVLAYYSYNAYLWHFLILIPIVHYFGYSIIGLGIYLSMTAILAVLSTHCIEDFFINRRKAIFAFFFIRKKTKSLNSNV